MTGKGIEIVTAEVPAAAVFAGLHRECFDNGWSVGQMADILAMPGVIGLLGLADGAETSINDPGPEPCGFLIGRQMVDEAEIISIGVIPEQQSRGVGSRLIARFAASIRKRNVQAIFLEVAVDNIAAQALYRKYGFEHVGIRRAYYDRKDRMRRKVDACVMQKRLNDTALQDKRGT